MTLARERQTAIFSALSRAPVPQIRLPSTHLSALRTQSVRGASCCSEVAPAAPPRRTAITICTSRWMRTRATCVRFLVAYKNYLISQGHSISRWSRATHWNAGAMILARSSGTSPGKGDCSTRIRPRQRVCPPRPACGNDCLRRPKTVTFLKALLVSRHVRPARTHELTLLLRALRDDGLELGPLDADCALLTAHAINPRYPVGLRLTHEDAQAAYAAAQRIVTAVRANLGRIALGSRQP
jgi:hypothetical protein